MAKTITLQDLQTRFLWPFAYRANAVEAARSALVALDTAPTGVWVPGDSPRAYRDEYAAHARQFLFESDGGACAYLIVNKQVAESWLKGLELDLGGGEWLQMAGGGEPRIELFLSPHGAGVLSLNLAPSTKDLTATRGMDFNYRIAQFRRRDAARVRKRHPGTDPAVLAKLSDENRKRLPPVPDAESPLSERLGVLGGIVRPREIIDHLLAPLSSLEMREVQEELSVYTVARIGTADPSASDGIASFLSGLAQVEESNHAGSLPGTVTTDSATLNRCHWAAASALGAAHVVADQGGVDFDEQRVPIVRDKYFIAHLLSLLQRTAIQGAVSEAGTIAAGIDAHSAERFESLRKRLLDFGIHGNFVHVSARHSVQRSYEMARAGLRVESAWSSLRGSIADIDAANSASQQKRVAQRSEQHLESIVNVQKFVHVIEYAIVSVYCAHLWHMMHIELPNCLSQEEGDNFHQWVGVLTAALIGFAAAYGVDRWLLPRLRHDR